MSVDVVLNGRAATLDAEPGEMLLEPLRRATCSIGVCGACTVLLDGDPVSGCLTLAHQAQGREITTVEGLGGAHPVQKAFVEQHAFQCGWCTPGFILAAVALLEDRPDPSPREIAEALGGNLCRCGSYVKIVEAVRSAAATRRS
jgi:aerobic-type carbon monoxide dehydrogenase small subunit (CoxS/CutS family)